VFNKTTKNNSKMAIFLKEIK